MAASIESLEVLVAFGADNGVVVDGLEVLVALGTYNGVSADNVEVLAALTEGGYVGSLDQPKFVLVNT